jgi:hypothetical protein
LCGRRGGRGISTDGGGGISKDGDGGMAKDRRDASFDSVVARFASSATEDWEDGNNGRGCGGGFDGIKRRDDEDEDVGPIDRRGGPRGDDEYSGGIDAGRRRKIVGQQNLPMSFLRLLTFET